jgi:hypothetical protein
METSKKIIFSVIVLTYLFVLFVCVIIVITLDLSPLAYLIPAIFGLATTALAFYSWKAKNENKIKLEIYKIQEEEKLKRKYKNDKIKINTDINEDSFEDNGGQG